MWKTWIQILHRLETGKSIQSLPKSNCSLHSVMRCKTEHSAMLWDAIESSVWGLPIELVAGHWRSWQWHQSQESMILLCSSNLWAIITMKYVMKYQLILSPCAWSMNTVDQSCSLAYVKHGMKENARHVMAFILSSRTWASPLVDVIFTQTDLHKR